MSDDHMSPTRRTLLGAGAALGTLATASLLEGGASASTPSVSADLSGKTVLITGSSSGFGRLAALRAARAGAKTIATMRNLAGGRRTEALELAEIAAREGLDLHLVELDVNDAAMVRSAIAEGERLAGGAIDALVNNAGIGLSGPVELTDDQGLDLIFETNVFGYMRTARAALPAMRRARRGLIINVSSQLGRVVMPGVGAYSASKHAVEAMFEALAYELAPHGVEVTIVQPGGYPTNIWRTGEHLSDEMVARSGEEQRAAYAEFLAASRRRFAGGGTTDPDDVAKAIVEIIALPAGRRPLRRPVHPNTRATEAINACAAQVQAAALGNGPFGPWHAAVTD